MHLEEALKRIEEIVSEIEHKQLPLHEIMKLHEEGQKLIGHSEKLLSEARDRLKLTEVEIDSEGDSAEGGSLQDDPDNTGEINLF